MKNYSSRSSTKQIGATDTKSTGGAGGPFKNQKVLINIAVLGDPKSGKTSLIECFLFGSVSERYKDTVLNIYQSNITEKKFKMCAFRFYFGILKQRYVINKNIKEHKKTKPIDIKRKIFN